MARAGGSGYFVEIGGTSPPNPVAPAALAAPPPPPPAPRHPNTGPPRPSGRAEARAQTAKAQVAVLDTKRDFDRKTELFARQLIAKSDLDTSQAAHDSAIAQLDSARAHEQALESAIQSAIAQLRVAEAMLVSARAQVEQKDAGLKQAQVDLDHTTIRAPVHGVVVSRQVDVGQTVAASLQAPVLFTIAQDLTKMQVETSVDEADIGRIKLDDRATFTVDSFPGATSEGP